MTDIEENNDPVVEDNTETAVKKKTSTRKRKKATVKASSSVTEEKAAEVTEAQVVESASEATVKDDKRARLINKLKDMGMMPGAASASVTEATGTVANSKKPFAMNVRKFLTPQVLAVAAGACVFTVLVWSLEQERQQASTNQTANSAPVYAPYGTAPVTPFPAAQPPVAVQHPYQPPQGKSPQYQAQAPSSSAPQSMPSNPQAQATYPAPVWYPNSYGYGYHPSMQFGINSRIQSRASGAPYYYGYGPYYAPPVYPYPPAVGQPQR